LGAALPASIDCKLDARLALICGTSSCHMACASDATFVPGVWGPYFSAMIPELWLLEGGQSATGSLIDHVVQGHPARAQAEALAAEKGTNIWKVLSSRLDALAKEKGLASSALLTTGLHVLPYFHGNRSPRADPSLVGCVSGLTLRYCTPLHWRAIALRALTEW
jgi:ribulose kinase